MWKSGEKKKKKVRDECLELQTVVKDAEQEFDGKSRIGRGMAGRA